VWQKAHAFVLAVYRFSATFPSDERFGLTSQMRRAAVSVPANIAEGFRRRGRAEKARFMNIAEASLQEVRYYMILARDLYYGSDASLDEQANDVERLLAAYIRAIRESDAEPTV
jgi:four helix bundle protein